MKRFLTLMLLASMVLFPACAQNSDEPDPSTQLMVYGVAFYNVENLFDTINSNGKYDLEFSPQGSRQWDSAKYWSKIDNLARCIAAMKSDATPFGPAVIGIAEVENRSVLEDLVNAEALREDGLRIVHHDSPDLRGIDVSLLYNPALFEVIDVKNYKLNVPSQPDFLTRDQMCVTGRMGNDTVSIIVNHWPSRLGGAEKSSPLRETAANLSYNIARILWNENPRQGVIIMGDLNDDPMDPSCAVVLGAKREMAGVEPHGFFNPWWSILDRGVGTLAYQGAWNLFDQIIVSGTLLPANTQGLQYWKSKVNDFEFLRSDEGYPRAYPLRTYSRGKWLNGYSDHYPTEVFLIKKL